MMDSQHVAQLLAAVLADIDRAEQITEHLTKHLQDARAAVESAREVLRHAG